MSIEVLIELQFIAQSFGKREDNMFLAAVLLGAQEVLVIVAITALVVFVTMRRGRKR